MMLPIKFRNKTTALVLSITLILLAIFIFDISVYLTTKNKVKVVQKQVLGTKTSPLDKIKYWEGFLKDNPKYFAGWIELAELEVEMGNYFNAKDALNQAEQINPNSPQIREIEKKIQDISN